MIRFFVDAPHLKAAGRLVYGRFANIKPQGPLPGLLRSPDFPQLSMEEEVYGFNTILPANWPLPLTVFSSCMR